MREGEGERRVEKRREEKRERERIYKIFAGRLHVCAYMCSGVCI